MRHTIMLTLFVLLIGCNKAASRQINEQSACQLLEKDSLQRVLSSNIAFQPTPVDDFERRLNGVASRCTVVFVDAAAPTTFTEQHNQPSVVYSLYSPQSFAVGNRLLEEKGKKPRLDFERHWSNLIRNQHIEALPRGLGFIREVSAGKMKETQGLLRHDDLLVVISATNIPLATTQQLLLNISQHSKL